MRPAQDTIDIRRDLVSLLPRLRRFALTITHDGRHADDLVLAVCDRAISQESAWSGRGRMEGALYTLARTMAAEIADRSAPLQSDTPPTGAGRQMLLALPENLASVFLLVVVEGHSYRDTGEILDIPQAEVARTVAAARMRLAALSAETTEKRA